MARQNHKELYKKMLVDFIQEEDPIYSMLKWTLQQMTDIEAENVTGAPKGKHSLDRKTHLSGTRMRRFDTRMGTMYLLIPKVRKGGYIPFFIAEKKRSEQALISLVQEAYINGVSTRKVERVAKKLGIEGISAGQVSEINKHLNDQVQEFRTRTLEKEYPFIWIDAVYEKIRFDGKVISQAIMIAYGVNSQGQREILAIEPMFDESAENWQDFLKKLKDRGLKNICLCISDAHKGIQKALKKEFAGSSWQRCKVHFMRNILAKIPHKQKKLMAEKIKQIWLQSNKQESLKYANTIIDEYAKKYPEAMDCLEEGLEDSIAFYDFPEIDKRKISSTNVLERINREVRRRSRVVGVFPSRESYIRLLTCYLIEYSEDWYSERNYIKQDGILIILQRKEAMLKKVA